MAMQRIPLHAGETQTFVPTVFAEMESPPSFTLKAPTRRHREDMQYALHEARLRRHNDEDMREAMVDELCRLWQCEETDEKVERLRAYWQAIDEYNDEIESHLMEVQAAKDTGQDPPTDLAPFEHPDSGPVEELIAQLARASDLLGRMGTENVRFSKEFPRYAIAHCVIAWTGFETEPRFEAGTLKIDSVVELLDELEARFDEKGELAFIELASAAVGRFYVTKATEKNSASGPASQQTPRASKVTGSASPNGNSPASVSSDATPAA